MAGPQLITPKPKKPVPPQKTSVTFKVPTTVGDDLKALKTRVKRHAGEVDFNLDNVVSDTLARLIKQANGQLDKLGHEGTEGVTRDGTRDSAESV